MQEAFLERYSKKKILGVYTGDDAWKKLVPIRWPQVEVRAGVRRRFKNDDMSHALLIIFVTPKTGTPKQITVHFYPTVLIPNIASIDVNTDIETDDLWITSAPYSLVEVDDAPKLLKKLVKELSSKK